MKPIHKLNNGRGATLCNTCSIIITTGLTKELYCEKCKPKQETLEEAAEKYVEDFDLSFYDTVEEIPVKELGKKDFIEGAKWQQQNSYSEEEAGELVYNIMGEYAKRENIFFKGDLINNLFNKFKKQIK